MVVVVTVALLSSEVVLVVVVPVVTVVTVVELVQAEVVLLRAALVDAEEEEEEAESVVVAEPEWEAPATKLPLLPEADDAEDEDAVERYRAQIDELEAGGVAEDVVRALRKELGRFERMPEQNMERGWIQGWLDTVLGLPWTERSTDTLDVVAARAVLDADHTGLDEVKERIVEMLAVRKLLSADPATLF